MTDYKMNAEPGGYEAHGSALGMSRLVAAWHRRSAEQRAEAIKARGALEGRAGVIAGEGVVRPPAAQRIDTARTPDASALGIEGQEPGVEEVPINVPELLIPAAIITVAAEVPEGELVEAVMLPWFEIVKALGRDPNLLHQLEWRMVEELIAGAYTQDGWPDVILTSRSGDGGRDIIASKPGFGAIRFYDQVKAYSPGHPVPANDVRAIFGVVNLHQNVSKAVITTTASFAPGVYEEFKPVMPNRLELRDGSALRRWLLGLLPDRS